MEPISERHTPAGVTAQDLHTTPNALAPSYSRFRVAERLLLTGHSHQAWPDCGCRGQQQAWLDAAELVDTKWVRAFARADRVRRGWRRLLDEKSGHITLGPNTHELVVRLLSALPLLQRPRIVTTDGVFHTLRRQLDRLAEAGIEIDKIPTSPTDDLAERLAAAANERTALVAVSSVMFHSARIVPGLERLATACRRVGAELLVDAYHSLNVVPFSVPGQKLEEAFVVGGGYKNCQLGEGNCFLRSPASCTMRPVITGWFSEFALLSETPDNVVEYGAGSARFDGATYDPTAHYRAAEVFDFFEARGLTPALLRQVSQHQISLLAPAFDALDLDPALIDRDRDVPLERLGGFLALRSRHAGLLSARLGELEVTTDYRDEILRLGPAPYLDDDQLRGAVAALGEAAASL